MSEILCCTIQDENETEKLINTRMDTFTTENIWDSRYYEASICLQEGANNDRFTIHPRDPARHFAYKVVHSTWFHLVNLFAPLCLLLLTVFEHPYTSFSRIPCWVHGVIEVTLLLVIAFELTIKFKWLGFKHFLGHKRTIFKMILLVLMLTEAIVLMARQASHFRITRALRPLFLLDSFYCRNIRRFIRQLLQSLSSLFNIFVLLIFFMVIFSILGFFLFSNNPLDTYFQSLTDSFISLFVLMTTANFPDVMLPSYKKSQWSVIFFIIYITIEIYIFMNMFLAVVYSAFIKTEKEKFKKLFLHKRNGCMLAYKLLLSPECPDGISFKHFKGCLNYYKPGMTTQEIYFLFKSLDQNDSGKLTLDEFVEIFNNIKLKWHKELENRTEVTSCRKKMQIFLFKIVSNNWFNRGINLIIFINFIWIVVDSFRLSDLKNKSFRPDFDWTVEETRFYWITVAFVIFYLVEMSMKVIGFGFLKYFSNGWNVFDFLVTVAALFGIFLQFTINSLFCIMVIRPLRVLRLLKIKGGLRHVFGSLYMLLPRILNLVVVLLLLFYFYAIIGMEFFAPYTEDLKNCCTNTSVQQYYAYPNGSGIDGYYYLCTFDNIINSGVTLFELTVINNWWIIMEGYAHVISPWTRIYFMLFYLSSMVVMAVVVAFTLEVYLFREQCREDYEGHRYHRVLVRTTHQELTLLESGGDVSAEFWKELEPPTDMIFYEGTRRLEKDDFSLKMYSSEVKDWLNEPL